MLTQAPRSSVSNIDAVTEFIRGLEQQPRSIDVAIPWRATPDRIPAFEYVAQWWVNYGFNVITGDSDHETFNLSAARNRAVAKATSNIVVVADADTVPDAKALDTAIYACRRHGGVWWPFDTYTYLADSVKPGDNLENAPTEHVYPNSVGGLFVILRADYWRLGGFDERFDRWGHEDRAWELVVTELSSFHRVPGTVYAFNHYAERNMRGPGRLLVEEYRRAARTHRMAQYLATRGT